MFLEVVRLGRDGSFHGSFDLYFQWMIYLAGCYRLDDRLAFSQYNFQLPINNEEFSLFKGSSKRGQHCQRWNERCLRGFPIANLVRRTLKTNRANPNDSNVAHCYSSAANV